MKNPIYFSAFIKSIRNQEEVLLYQNILETNEKELKEISTFLSQEYFNESLDFPFQAPIFDPKAALFAAKKLYVLAQLLLYRKDNESDLDRLLSDHYEPINASSILSIDLLFRFLPQFRHEFSSIDPEDLVLSHIDQLLQKWHYSGIEILDEISQSQADVILQNPCIKQLYLNRIYQFKNKKLAQLPFFINEMKTIMGDYQQKFWKELI